MISPDSAIQAATNSRDASLEELKEFIRIPSISAQPEHLEDVNRAARWLCDWIISAGGEAELLATKGHPLVWGRLDADVAGAPTVLIYGHYDVQPVDPLDLWESDPFDPVERGDRLYARGASDMKSQIIAALSAVRALRNESALGANLVFLFEGEEEVGSPSLAAALRKHRARFRADFCLNPDTGMISEDVPSIRYGLRGLTYVELHLTGPERDLHSGAYGGVVHNPAQALTEVLAGLHDRNGTVRLPGFYDRVRGIEGAEKERLAAVPFSEDDIIGETGVKQVWGEPGFSVTERVTARPTLEINGIISGYTGAGAKTVIPSHAMAKISTRLVPDQQPDEAVEQLRTYLREHVPSTMNWELEVLAGGAPYICEPDSPAHLALSRALTEVWGVTPLLSRSGGSVPVATELQEIVGVPSILTGFALPGDRVHSPNESQHLPTLWRGVNALIRFFAGIAGS